jgi:dethiobiotin synthetase
MHAFFVAATGQNVGKTTTCLGLVAGLKKRFGSAGYLKPVGQEYVETESGVHVDKDVLLFKSYFKLKDPDEEMSPVLFPRGFTRDYLDGKVDHQDLVGKIQHAYRSITQRHKMTVIEGTGHTGVGSIVDLNNAQVAAQLKCPLILVASGGLGSSFDELSLNYAQCEKYKVPVAGVILNRVLDEKREMILEYIPKALKRWNLPLLGCIPYTPFLSMPTLSDFELLFRAELLSGQEHRFRHFKNISLMANSTETHQLVIAPATREDLVLALLTRYWDLKISHPEEDLETGLILTGKTPPKASLIDQIRKAKIPMLYTPVSSFIAMKMIHSYTAKIRKEDVEKIEEAIKVVESHIDFDRLEKALQR